MDTQETILEQYKGYIEQKEKFVDRSFMTNKFYLGFLFVIIIAMFLTREYSFAFGITSTMVLTLVGMLICVMWWINVDAYNFLIKIKFGEVIEKLEDQLPVHPYKMEINAINDRRKNKKEFIFSDIQKSLAILVFVLFFVLFINDLLNLVLN